MAKDIAGQENNEIKGSLSNPQNTENLEISSTGYGFESVRKESKKQRNRSEM